MFNLLSVFLQHLDMKFTYNIRCNSLCDFARVCVFLNIICTLKIIQEQNTEQKIFYLLLTEENDVFVSENII